MKTFSYPIFAKIVYRYANIFITFVLLSHLVVFIIAPNKNYSYLPLGLINIILIYIVNRFYFTNYKYFPYDIKADEEKIIVSNFVFNNRTETIYYKDIEKLTGGVFNKKPSTPIYVICNNGKKIGINTHLKEFNKLLTLILQHVSDSVYQNTLEEMKIKADEQIANIKTKINKAKERKTTRKKK
ncbi:MAG TPA: hypothetical protein PL041_04950 [Melioribacteraceae bacterium]|nr:hypothetical protein [Melioribacteraceae bacterium]